MTGILDESYDTYFATGCTGGGVRHALLDRTHTVIVNRQSQISLNKVFYLEFQLVSQVFVAFFFSHRRTQQSCIISIKR